MLAVCRCCEGAPVAAVVPPPPDCPEHVGARVVRAGTYPSGGSRRQRYQCHPADGSKPHQFTPPLSRAALARTLGLPEDSFTLHVTRDVGYDIDLNTEVVLDSDGRRIDQAYVDEVVEVAHRQLDSRRGEAQQ